MSTQKTQRRPTPTSGSSGDSDRAVVQGPDALMFGNSGNDVLVGGAGADC